MAEPNVPDPLDRPLTVRDVFTLCVKLRRFATREYTTFGPLADVLTVAIEHLAGEPDKPEWR